MIARFFIGTHTRRPPAGVCSPVEEGTCFSRFEEHVLMAEYQFDVVIVGGGSAGCAVAGRLCTTTDLRVCLVEAGPD